MRVLMTADGVGGVWTYATELARGLAAFDVEILLVTSGGPLSEAQKAEAAALPNVRLVETHYKLEWMPDPWGHVAAFGRRLRDLADGFRPDVVHLNEFAYGRLDWNCPVLVVGHSCVCSWFENVRGHAPGGEWDRYRETVRRGLRGADLVAAPTRFMLDALVRHYGPFEATRVLPNGSSPPEVADEAKEPFVFAAGRWWDEAKNVAAIGRVAPRVGWPVKVAGLPSPDGAGTALPENVENLGRLTADEMRHRYARASIYCLPARYEPFGLTPLEAASHGCALVLGDIPSLREVWGDAAAFVPPDDADALAATLIDLIGNDEARGAAARRAKVRAAAFGRDRTARGYFATYRELLQGAGMNHPEERPSAAGREGESFPLVAAGPGKAG